MTESRVLFVEEFVRDVGRESVEEKLAELKQLERYDGWAP